MKFQPSTFFLHPFVWFGFWLRLSFMLGGLYFYDEFISMLAAKMVAESGLTILPSGFFYGHGLLLSYLTGPLIVLTGFKEELARWPVLWLSVFTIAAYYVAARRLFGSRLAGLLAAGLVTLDELSILWGTRARMYSQAHLFAMLSLTWLLLGTLQRSNPRLRYLGLAFLAAALFSHAVTFLILPPLALLVLLFSWFYRRDWLRQPRLWQEVGVALLIMAAALVVMTGGTFKPGGIEAAPPAVAGAITPTPTGLKFLESFLDAGLAWTRFDNLVGFFSESPYDWLLPFIALALLFSLYRLWQRKVTFADVVFFFLTLFIVLVIFEMGAFVADTWSKSRYIFIIALPAFLLLSAGSLARLLEGVVWLVSRMSRNEWLLRGVSVALAVGGIALIATHGGRAAWDMAQAQSTGDYHTAFAYVREHWQPGDKVMTTHPAAAYLYLGRNDYYANQVSAIVFQSETEENALLDRYTGSSLVESVENLNTILGEGGRVWFVVDALRLYQRFTPLFTQEIFAQMDLVDKTGATYVFLSRSHPFPLPAEPQTRLEANFSNVIHLAGYSLDSTQIGSDGLLPVGLYWQLVGTPSRNFKVFVQLRNGQGQTIAQSDHFLLEGLLTLEVWNSLQQQGEWLRDTAELPLPQLGPAGAGPYRLYVGFYDPDTQQRFPLLNDTSGENAAVIELPF